MLYLKKFTFPDGDTEFDKLLPILTKWHNSVYPFKILSKNFCEQLTFAPITILYGSNGSGKTTALNIIAEKLKLQRETLFNSSTYFSAYLSLCDYQLVTEEIPQNSAIITSDDVFDYMLNKRLVNNGIDRKREELITEYFAIKEEDQGQFRYREQEDLQKLEKLIAVRNNTLSMYVKKNLGLNLREKSNGESALGYFTEKITEDALYLLDEPENSLAPERQLELAQFLEEAVRFYNCQLIIATHSPFLLALRDAKLYDLDSCQVCCNNWQDLPNIRIYYDFFQKHREKFSN